MHEFPTGVGRSARVLLGAVAGVLATLLLAAPGVAGAPTVGCENRTNNTYDKVLGCMTLEGVREHQAALQAIADANGGSRVAGAPGHDWKFERGEQRAATDRGDLEELPACV